MNDRFKTELKVTSWWIYHHETAIIPASQLLTKLPLKLLNPMSAGGVLLNMDCRPRPLVCHAGDTPCPKSSLGQQNFIYLHICMSLSVKNSCMVCLAQHLSICSGKCWQGYFQLNLDLFFSDTLKPLYPLHQIYVRIICIIIKKTPKINSYKLKKTWNGDLKELCRKHQHGLWILTLYPYNHPYHQAL